MGWTLFLFGLLALVGGLASMLLLPAIMQAYTGPLFVVGGIWIGCAGIIERIDMLRRTLSERR
jgi:hypothetical protein